MDLRAIEDSTAGENDRYFGLFRHLINSKELKFMGEGEWLGRLYFDLFNDFQVIAIETDHFTSRAGEQPDFL